MLRQGQASAAENRLREAVAREPGHVEAHLVLGILLGRTGRWDLAAEHLSRVVADSPNRDEALYWLALARKNLGDPVGASQLCERALGANPRNPTVLNELGLCRMTLNQPELAAEAFADAIKSDPKVGVYRFNHGLSLARLDRIQQARAAFEEAIRLDPRRVEAYLELARILETLNQRDEVVALLKRALEVHPTNSQLLSALASATAFQADRESAEVIFRRSMEADPTSANAFGQWLQQEGRFEESVGIFLKSIREKPVQGVAYYGLAEAKVFEIEGARWAPRAEAWLESTELDLKGKTYLCYALAKANERAGNVRKTIELFDRANAFAFSLHNEGRPFDRAELGRRNDEIISRFPAPAVRQPVEGASGSDRPIFIVGMIRSGTTLLDQVISSHRDVGSAGEPVFWMREADRVRKLGGPLSAGQVRELAENYLKTLEAADGTASRVTDKMPLNYAHLGLIHQVFPKAKIIHLRRKPLDTCFSIYTTYLGRGPNFAYNASNIVFNYREYLRLMSHWRSILPADALWEVDYESLIEDREKTVREVIAFLGLAWDDSCLAHEQNESSIRTPSKWQARQPIYRSSIERWRPYETWLGELIELQNE